MALIRLTFPPRCDGWHLRSAGITALECGRSSDSLISKDCVREDHGVARDGARVRRDARVIVDMALPRRLRDDQTCSPGRDLGGVEYVGVAICGAGEDVVDLGMPVHDDEGRPGGYREGVFGAEGCWGEDVEVAEGVAGDEVGGVGGEDDVGFRGGGGGE